MAMRSWLFVPGDSEKKLSKAAGLGADVLIIDLEDAVAPNSKALARNMATEWFNAHRHGSDAGATARKWVRINALDTSYWRADVAAVIGSGLEGIMVPKAAGPQQLQMLSAELYELEQRHRLPTNSIKILPLTSETAMAALRIADYAIDPVPRLAGLTWGAEDLSAAIGAARKRDASGAWTDLFRMIRSTTLLTAHARGVMPIDTLHADFRDEEGLKRVASASYADGFSGMLAIHPAQVPIINAAFSPTAEQIAEANAIVEAFAANPGIGAVQVDGRMVDQPHLHQARRLLDTARR